MPVIVLLYFWFIKQKSKSKNWANIVDKKLQPFVLLSPDQQSSSRLRWWSLAALILCVLSLAGPAWEKIAQTVFKPQSALVIVLDLSHSMDAADIKPTRLSRAKLKIIDLLNTRKEGQTALVVYAAESFTVSPLSEDSETVIALLKSLNTSLMPAQGSRMDKALVRANQLIKQAGINQGHILVVSDGVSASELDAIQDIEKHNNSVSIMAVGTEQGAPIKQKQGDYLKGSSGQIVISKMNADDLLSIAQKYKGAFVTLRHDDADIEALLTQMSLNRFEGDNKRSQREFDIWVERGPWLLWLVLPVFLMVFRRGMLVALLMVVLPMPEPVYAQGWQDWFKNDNQKAEEQFKEQQFEAAEQQFKQGDWKAAAQYKNKQYEDAIKSYKKLDGEEALYNQGNALAQMQQYKEAIKAWDELLKDNPQHEDALFNKKQVEELLKSQQKQDPNGQQQNDQKQDQEEKNQQQQDQDQQQQDQDQQQQDQDQQQQDQQQQDQQQQQQSDQQKKEAENGDQKDEKQQQEQQKQTEKERSEQQKKQQQEAEAKQQEQKQKAKEEKEKKQQQAQKQKEQEQQQKDEQSEGGEKLNKELEAEPFDEKTKQWLRRIPDDPGGLMRNKFLYQYQQLNRQQNEQNPW